ncbi:MAG: agmatine deiminase family protein, partial [Candidatus Competibacteraceae bacterium]|nr:agmatine deiminase family protein [Candidatus Competibacteraceae bacterium]
MPETVLPAEWAPQSGVMLTWPHAQSDWRPYLKEAQESFLDLAQAIATREDLLIGCFDRGHLEEVRDLLAAARAPMERIHLHSVPSNDTWTRDHGPITVLRDGQPVLLDFRFNGWGEKFDAALDDFITRRLHQAGAFGTTPLEEIELILEGG